MLFGERHHPVRFPMCSLIKGKRLLPARCGSRHFIPDKSHVQGLTIRCFNHLKKGANSLCKCPSQRSEIQGLRLSIQTIDHWHVVGSKAFTLYPSRRPPEGRIASQCSTTARPSSCCSNRSLPENSSHSAASPIA